MRLRRFAPLGLLALTLPLGGANCPLLDVLNPPMGDGGMTDPDSCVDDSFSAETAFTLALGEEVTEVLCPIRDVDWWRFEVAEPGTLIRIHLWMETNLTPVDPGYTVVTGDDTPTGISGRHEGRTPGEPVDFVGLHRVEEAGTYLIKIADVEGFDDRFDDANPYHLVVETLPDPDGNEPNDTPEDATPLPLDAGITGLIGTTGDEDWYAVPVEDDAQLLDVDVRAPADIGLDLVVEILRPDTISLVDTQDLVEAGMEFAAQTRVAVAGGPGDVFYLRIFEQSGMAANEDPETGTYEIVATLSGDPDDNEVGGGNDAIESATDLPAETDETATLASAGDQDVYAVSVPGDASPNNPYVLLVDLSFTGGVPDDVQPQLRITTTNPERSDGELPPCDDDCVFCLPIAAGGEPAACGQDYLQRVLAGQTYEAAFPLRRDRPVFITVNDFGDDGYLDAETYTLRYEVVADPDPGEQGDDYLIPNLQTATYDNEDELDFQYARSRERARVITQGFEPACEPPEYELVDGGVTLIPPPDPCADAGPAPVDAGADGGACVPPPPPACQEVVGVPDPVGDPMEPLTVACDGQDWTVTASGRLTYEGDRDFFRFDVPNLGYWSLDAEYDVSAPTPVELTVFVHDSEKLIGAFLEAEETQGNCETSTDCPVGSVCIDGKCWADNDDNPAFTGHTFPGEGQCLYVHTNFTQRPLYIEVTDNGINDFDLDMSYEVRLRVRCGCPDACDATGPGDQCQGVAPPQ